MKKLLYFILILILLVGCATTGKLLRINLQMNKDEVLSTMGKPTAVRGSMTNKYGQVIEVWEYALYKKWIGRAGGRTYYRLYFYEGKLVQWGEAGDWQREADIIYETKFR
jgi:hypothetical protein